LRGEPFPHDASMRVSQPKKLQSLARRAATSVAAAIAAAVVFVMDVLGRLLRPAATRLTALYIRGLSVPEWRTLVKAARGSGAFDASGSAMLAGVLGFHHKRAQDVMRPRTEIVAIPIDAPEGDVLNVLREQRYSRYPVYQDNPDDVVGIFVAKDLWLRHEEIGLGGIGANAVDSNGARGNGAHGKGAVGGGASTFSLRALMREALYVPGSRPADRVLDDLRRTRAHMAIVLDEYGGTAGIITMEDLIEQVMGEIADEYDPALRSSMEINGVLELAGSLSLIDVRSQHELRIPEGKWTTLGGFAFAKLGRAPRIGDRVQFPGGELEVIAVEGRRVAALRVHAAPAAPAGV